MLGAWRGARFRVRWGGRRRADGGTSLFEFLRVPSPMLLFLFLYIRTF